MVERLSGSGTETVRSSDRLLELIKPYAEMGMSSDEIEYALLYDAKGKVGEHTRRSIGIFLGQARRTGAIPNLETEEQQDIQADHDSPKKNPQERVLKWLIAREVLGESVSLPKGRFEWKKMVEKLEAEGIIESIISATKPLILRRIPLKDAVGIYQQGQKTRALTNEEKSLYFAWKCLEAGFIEEEPSNYIALHNLYGLSNRSLPGSSAEKLRLEAFFVSRSAATTRDAHKRNELLLKYKELGEEVGHEWFDKRLAEEEDFISTVMIPPKEEGYGEDDLGIFRLGPDGERWRTPIGINDNGQIVYDDSFDLVRRRESRELTQGEQSRSNKPSYSSLA